MDLLELLLPHLDDADLSRPAGQDGWTALHACADMGAARTAERLLRHPAVRRDARDRSGRSPAQLAEAAGHAQLVALLAAATPAP